MALNHACLPVPAPALAQSTAYYNRVHPVVKQSHFDLYAAAVWKDFNGLFEKLVDNRAAWRENLDQIGRRAKGQDILFSLADQPNPKEWQHAEETCV